MLLTETELYYNNYSLGLFFFSIVTQVQVDLFKDIKFWKQFRQMCPQGKQNKWYFLFFLFLGVLFITIVFWDHRL